MKPRVGDGLWVRLVDVGEALSARGYATDGAVVFDVIDEFCPWNAGLLAAGGGRAKRTTAAPQLRLDVTPLGCAYLGAFSFSGLVRGGRVEELRRGGAARADFLSRKPSASIVPRSRALPTRTHHGPRRRRAVTGRGLDGLAERPRAVEEGQQARSVLVDPGAESEAFVEDERHRLHGVAAVAERQFLLRAGALHQAGRLVEERRIVREAGEEVIRLEDAKHVVARRRRVGRRNAVGSEPPGSAGPSAQDDRAPR